MDEKKLYPLRFVPTSLETPSAQENYHLADLGYIDTKVEGGWLDSATIGDLMETYLDRIVGDNVYYYFGRLFPVMVKVISTKETLPLLVCPSDEISVPRYDSLGRKKLWYILDTEPGAALYLGTRKPFTATEFYGACMDESILGGLERIEPKVGESYLIEPGTVHCAKSGLTILEISESSALDFHLCTWDGRYEEDSFVQEGFGIADALDFVRFTPGGWRRIEEKGSDMVSEQEFDVRRIRVEDAMRVFSGEVDSFIVYVCTEGRVAFQVQEEDEDGKTVTRTFTIGKGQVILVPADCEDFFIVPESPSPELLEVTLRRMPTPDSFLSADKSDFLEDEGEDDEDEEDDTPVQPRQLGRFLN